MAFILKLLVVVKNFIRIQTNIPLVKYLFMLRKHPAKYKLYKCMTFYNCFRFEDFE